MNNRVMAILPLAVMAATSFQAMAQDESTLTKRASHLAM